MTEGTPREKLHSLQGLRAVAALIVVVFHIANHAAFAGTIPAAQLGWLKLGADCAVDCFFVLSGFIMVYTQRISRRTAGEFARQRLARIVPLYWVSTLAFAAFILAFDAGPEGPMARLSASRNFLASSMLFVSHLLGYRFPVVLPGWSLEYEMLFYAVFAGAIAATRRHTVALACAAVLALALFGVLRPLCIEFAWGAGIGVLWFRGLHRQLAAVALLAAPAVVGGGLVEGIYARIDDSDWLRLVFCGLPMLTVFLAVLCSAQKRRPVLGLLGECSYAIYLTHCVWLAIFVRFAMPPLGAMLPRLAVMACGFCWCVAGGIAMHHFVERRFDRLLRGGRRPDGGPAPANRAARPA